MSASERAAKALNPLSIILLFFSFTEVMLGYAVFNTTGGIQVVLTTFVIIFPTLVATIFFIFLWHRPRHLYAPKDYGSDENYLRSMADARKDHEGIAKLESQIETLIVEKLTSKDLAARIAQVKGAGVDEVLRDAATELSRTIREQQFFRITFGQFAPDIDDIIVPVDGFGTFSELLNELYFKLQDRVRPYYYGEDWILKNATTGETLSSARMISGAPPGVALLDTRPLIELGIEAGTHLEVIHPAAKDRAAGIRR